MTMKFIQRALVNIPNQVLSTMGVSAMALIAIRGAIAIWQDPPSPNTILIIMYFGIGLGILSSFGPAKEKEKSKND